jgi:hypothetical protein
MVSIAAESVLPAGWGKQRCCKNGGIAGNFRPRWCGSRTVGGGPYRNRLTVAAKSGTGCMMTAVVVFRIVVSEK